jgi:hypothetical protein
MAVRALGTIIEWDSEQPLAKTEFYSGLLDYFDWWFEVDPRPSEHHDFLSPPSFAFGHDLVNLATYANEILAGSHLIEFGYLHRSLSSLKENPGGKESVIHRLAARNEAIHR